MLVFAVFAVFAGFGKPRLLKQSLAALDRYWESLALVCSNPKQAKTANTAKLNKKQQKPLLKRKKQQKDKTVSRRVLILYCFCVLNQVFAVFLLVFAAFAVFAGFGKPRLLKQSLASLLGGLGSSWELLTVPGNYGDLPGFLGALVSSWEVLALMGGW